jgi:hypothetical protein
LWEVLFECSNEAKKHVISERKSNHSKPHEREILQLTQEEEEGGGKTESTTWSPDTKQVTNRIQATRLANPPDSVTHNHHQKPS